VICKMYCEFIVNQALVQINGISVPDSLILKSRLVILAKYEFSLYIIVLLSQIIFLSLE